MLYLAHWARKLSWKETALRFGTTWDQVCHAVEYVVQWGLAHRELGTLRAVGVDEIHIGKSGKFLTLVYQIEADRKAYGYRTFRIAEISLYHVLGRLPEPKLAHRFF